MIRLWLIMELMVIADKIHFRWALIKLDSISHDLWAKELEKIL